MRKVVVQNYFPLCQEGRPMPTRVVARGENCVEFEPVRKVRRSVVGLF